MCKKLYLYSNSEADYNADAEISKWPFMTDEEWPRIRWLFSFDTFYVKKEKILALKKTLKDFD